MTDSSARRRRRAAVFAVLALMAAAAAALVVAGYGASVARTYGPLRPVVVAVEALRADQVIDPARATAALAVRRVPVRFIPVGALRRPTDAIGLAPRTVLPAGSYLLAGQLGPPRVGSGGTPARARFAGTPVQIAVTGADALLVADPTPAGSRVDVVVTSEPTGLGPGRTFVAAADVRLIALGPGPEGPGPTGSATATLALSRKQALRLISAENFARQVRLLPRAQARGVRPATQGG
jgi:pilus assembly protein CpaB